MASYDLEDEAIRGRLADIADVHSQADIARKTGASRASVNQYLKGTRIPAGFCAALVQNLGVNPVWLLSGDGKPFHRGASTGATTADDLLELVQALSSTARMLYGSLVGKGDLPKLRELSDAIQRFRSLRKDLAEAFEPLAKQLEGDLGDAMAAKELANADQLCKALRQVAELMDSEKYQLVADEKFAVLSYYKGDFANALEMRERMFWQEMGRKATSAPDRLGSVCDFVMALDGSCLTRRASRMARAGLAYAQGSEDTYEYQFLAFIAGTIEVQLGNILQGLSEMQSAFVKLPERYKKGNAYLIKTAQWLVGLTTMEEAIAVPAAERGHTDFHRGLYAKWVLRYSTLTGDSALMKRAQSKLRKDGQQATAEIALILINGAQAAIAGEPGVADAFIGEEAVSNRLNSGDDYDRMNFYMHAALLAVYGKEYRRALELVAKSGAYRKLLSDDVMESLALRTLKVRVMLTLHEAGELSANDTDVVWAKAELSHFNDSAYLGLAAALNDFSHLVGA